MVQPVGTSEWHVCCTGLHYAVSPEKVTRNTRCFKFKNTTIQEFLYYLYILLGAVQCLGRLNFLDTGKSLSEALIFASTNPQYDDILFIELQVQYMKIPSSEHVGYIN